MKIKFRFLMVLCVLVAMIFSTGVYASWKYADQPVPEQNSLVGLAGKEFSYTPEEILPGDEESTTLHQNHQHLVTNIVDHVTYGLNATSKPIVRELLEEGAGLVYSNQKVQGGNLKHMLLNTSDVDELGFVVQYVTDTEYHTYTFASSTVYAANVGKTITVYKTIMVYDGTTWDATTSYEGSAQIARVATSAGEYVYSIDVSTYK